MQVIRYFLCLGDIGEKSLNRLLIVTAAYIKKQPPEVICKKGLLKNLTIFIEKHLCWWLFLIKLQA